MQKINIVYHTKKLIPKKYKSDFVKYFFSSLAEGNIKNGNKEKNIPREDSYFYLKGIFTRLEFQVTGKLTANKNTGDVSGFSLLNLRAVTPFSETEFIKCFWKRLEKNDNIFITSNMRAKTTGLFYGIDRKLALRRLPPTDNKSARRKKTFHKKKRYF